MKKAAAAAEPAVLNDASVAEFLEAFPEFFERNPGLLRRIRLPDSRGSGTTVSLLEKQVDVLRTRNRQLERKLAQFIEVARGNEELAARIHRLTARLVDARGLNCVVDAVEASLREDFDVQRAVMVLFRDLMLNLSPHRLPALTRALHLALAPADPKLTDAPLATTPKRTFGVDDFCRNCRVCECPHSTGSRSIRCSRNCSRRRRA